MAQQSGIQAYVASQLATAEDQVAALQRLRSARQAEDVAGAVGQAVLDTLREALARYMLPFRRLMFLAVLPLLTAAGIGLVMAIAPAAGLPPMWSPRLPTVLRLLVAGWVAFRLGRSLLRFGPELKHDPPLGHLRGVRRNRREYIIVSLLALLALLVPLVPGPAGLPPGWVYWTLDAVPILVALVIAANDSFLRGLAPLAGSVPRAVGPLPAGGMAELQERIVRLKQMQEWMADDKLRAMVDDAIGKQVKQSERRQATYAAIAAVASLVVGWLLSAITPASALAGLLGHAPR